MSESTFQNDLTSGCSNIDPAYRLCSELDRMQWDRVHGWLTTSYWSPGITVERIRRGAENSTMVLGIFWGEEQVGFGRVVSDKSRFAYLCDVWVDEEHRGKGLARALVAHALNHPDFQTVNWLLATQDAHGVYEKLGFKQMTKPEKWMMRGKFCTEEPGCSEPKR